MAFPAVPPAVSAPIPGFVDFFPAFILFLVLVLLVFGAGFFGFGGIGYEAEK
ncbi:hypothetical protein IT084_04395 [Desulfallas sp. Bu1-1]|jgi:L-cystine uptake protein TcyP (sodium:dicarboxylate symporter family)|uniref:hypothetical protein n=1 Tax=Desulfallas sp. Bu1-1 TaxID=2787620 RepID=UPI00189CEB3D|nr:hypothetical protein [Desulfallas sp. Bu1-1]MBF7082214.1 hypothetical protein [Desulfallas sp. Bu1-1]